MPKLRQKCWSRCGKESSLDLIREQQRRNSQAADAWSLYASHRDRVTQLLLTARTADSDRLLLLGAGNANDFDLSKLLKTYREVVLTDLDVSSLENGLARQGLAANDRIRIIAPVEITGIFAELSSLDRAVAADDEFINRCLKTLAQHPAMTVGSEFGVVGSVGLLTQLIEAIVQSIGETHPRFWEVAAAVRAQHLRFLLNLTRPGGSAVLVTEVVSSDSCPDLTSISESGLSAFVRREISARNFFHGTNPAALQRFLETDPLTSSQLVAIRFTEPWLWQFVARTYAVYGVTLQK